MPLSPASSSTTRSKNGPPSSKLRKKQKRLDAICEKEYWRNHAELNEGGGGSGNLGADTELRRSSRVRRAPTILDASPSPPKKRRRLEKRRRLGAERDVNNRERMNQSCGGTETPGTWKSRLRSRGKSVVFEVKEEMDSPRGKMEVFDGSDEIRGEEKVKAVEDEKEEELGGGILTIVKSKRPGRIKAAEHSGEGDKDDGMPRNLDDTGEVADSLMDGNGVTASVLETEMGSRNMIEKCDCNATSTLEKPTLNDSRLDNCNDEDNLESIDHSDKRVEQLESLKEGQDGSDVLDNLATSANQVENETLLDGKDSNNEKTLPSIDTTKGDNYKHSSNDTRGELSIKEGRRCGLCGGGTDGKPPKRLVRDMGESENEAYSGSSASEEPNYDLWDGFGDESGWLGRLLGPINDRYGIAGIWVHQHCAVWSPEVYFAGLGCLKNVRAALCRGRALKCTRCGRRGATIGCRVDRCPKTYHLPCARANGCIFDHRKFLIACTDHRHLFQPHGSQYLARIKKLKTRKMKLEIRKHSNDAWRKDIEAEEKWLENCGEDEEFLKRESKRLHRDLSRIAPVYIGGSHFDSEKFGQGWESVAGLTDVIQCLKEVVLLPLLYPEFFDNLGLTPPRGVLLHGYPGTGKTLVVRALIGACARGDRRIAYFARKGADCLGKYVGDAERQLRLLFQVAEKCQPSIIFFDEIDGLAPCRTRQQDQTHSSVVSTLLALLDGLKSRGSVIVIGATNRPDAVDPALRRPGRFDREIYFPLPSVRDRAAILSLHTQSWPKPISGSLLNWIARRTAGFAGADLQALCTQAAINALKRNFPLQEVLSAASEKASGEKRLPLPPFEVEERDWLEALLCSPPPCSHREAGNAANCVACSPLPSYLLPCLLQPLCTLLISLYLDERLWLPPALAKAAKVIKNVTLSALNEKGWSIDRWWSHFDDFLQEAGFAFEIERELSYCGILLGNNSCAGSHNVIDDTDNEGVKCDTSVKHYSYTQHSLTQGISFASTSKIGFRILIAGNPGSGQRHLASCLLHCFLGNVEIQKVDLATISQEGHGDLMQGIAQMLIKCACMKSCVVFMPRIDLWALEKDLQISDIIDSSSMDNQSSEIHDSLLKKSKVDKSGSKSSPEHSNLADMVEGQGASRSASHAWISFIEQVESIGVSTSLMILATSEVPCPELPPQIRNFFKSDGSSCSQSTPSRMSIPRFSVQIDGNFDLDLIVNRSVAEVSRNVVEQLVHLIHQRSHTHEDQCYVYRSYDSIEGYANTVSQGSDNGFGIRHEDRSQHPKESCENVPLPPKSRSLKGKSYLSLAISTFGYQVLQYPHFAELCWFTSKLKEGPCADISGPWKGWPFNSCIIRPMTSLENMPAGCSSSNIKSKEKSGVVRGLIAVGLMAYRGAYTSVKEVSLEIRKVLELLVEQVNAKVQAGKDKYLYTRILSQVAYLEDMVNSWAYSLKSIEVDPSVLPKPVMTTMGSPVNHTCEDNQIENKDSRLTVPIESAHDVKVLDGNPPEAASEKFQCLDMCNRNKTLNDLGSDGKVAISGGFPNNHSLPDGHMNNVVGNCAHIAVFEERGTESALSSLGGVDRVFGSSKDCNGVPPAQSFGQCENALGISCILDDVEVNGSGNVSTNVVSMSLKNTANKLTSGTGSEDENAIDAILSSDLGVYANSEVICLYQCCSECLLRLHDLTQKILAHKMGLNGRCWTIEDVHDVVASCSADLISAIRKCSLLEGAAPSSVGNSRYGSQTVSLECPKCKTSDPRISGKVVVPVECSDHSTGQHVNAKNYTYLSKLPGFRSKFTFRDGVLADIDPEKDVSFHCKFETLCFCSLLDLILMTKHPFD